MRLRPHRRNLVIWSQSASRPHRYGALRSTRLSRARQIRRSIRTGVLLTVVGLMPVARAVRVRWRPLLAGGVLTVAGVLMRSGAGGVVILPGLWFLLYAALIPACRREDQLERELAAYSTPAQRRDLEATLDRYPDDVTSELRDILARQATAAGNNPIPGSGWC